MMAGNHFSTTIDYRLRDTAFTFAQ